MEVRCDRCQTEHQLEDAKVLDSGGSVQCSDCGHTIVLGRGRAPLPATNGATVPDGEWLVETSHGRSLRAPDIATLHRWIIERRVTREDRVSHGGLGFQRIGDVPDLAPFFDVADSAERARRADTPAPVLLPGPPTPVLTAAALVPRASEARYPDVDDSTQTRAPAPARSYIGLPFKLLLTTLVATVVAYAGIALQQWYSRSRASAQSPAPVVLVKAAPTAALAPAPAPAADIEPLAPVVEAPAEPANEPANEPHAGPGPAAARRKGRASARAAASRASRPAPAIASRGKSAGGGPSPQIAAAQGYAALTRRQFPQAIELFTQALAGAPSNGTALFGLAEAYRESGQKAVALRAYRRYVQLLPAGPDAGRARLHIRQLEGKGK